MKNITKKIQKYIDLTDKEKFWENTYILTQALLSESREISNENYER